MSDTSASTGTSTSRPQRRRLPQAFKPGNRVQSSTARESERLEEARLILASLDREPSRIDRILIDELAATVVEARRRRKRGRSTMEQSKIIARITARLSGYYRSDPAVPPGDRTTRLARHLATLQRIEPEDDDT